MKINDIILTIKKDGTNYLTLDIITDITETDIKSNYVSIPLIDAFRKSYFPIRKFHILKLEDYLKNPEKYPIFYQKHIEIQKLWEKFSELNIVEARKFKLKLLNEYGNK